MDPRHPAGALQKDAEHFGQVAGRQRADPGSAGQKLLHQFFSRLHRLVGLVNPPKLRPHPPLFLRRVRVIGRNWVEMLGGPEVTFPRPVDVLVGEICHFGQSFGQRRLE